MSAPDSRAELFLGLISGTSADGIDAALVRFHGDGPHPRPELVCGRTFAWDCELRARLLALGQQAQALTLDEVGELDVRIGCAFASAADALIAAAGIARRAIVAIGSHGQTLRHRPQGEVPFTLQLGDAHVIAERCGLPVVADFRRRDVAAGGHGAPLVPAFHAATLHAPDEDRAVLNLGGIANLTLLPAHGTVRGFDTGPANGLMDAWCLRHTGQPFDADGAFAAQGRVDHALLTRLLAEPWFGAPPPKSTGRDQFHLDWVDAALAGDEAPADVQATLLVLTARTVADALRATQPRTRRVIVCGGGVHNPRLLAALAEALPEMRIESSAAHGLDPDFVEAMAFAWLAREHLARRPGNLPTVTGAAGPRILGALYPA
ncbi:anhydro-N-acetylmuramic acid kinase [Thermomonas alba]|uniref:anhydro-N-acetylmuramic acid kinase n=1 Tax=Thermomonas alba TaxID=2888525 RepID=UPI001F03348A|nr:anhydro-N-acetylmuramic acid kinase [Thermomonas alba]